MNKEMALNNISIILTTVKYRGVFGRRGVFFNVFGNKSTSLPQETLVLPTDLRFHAARQTGAGVSSKRALKNFSAKAAVQN